MARNSDGTVVLKTTGKLSQTPRGSGTGLVVTHAYKAIGTRGHRVYDGLPRKGWRIVARTER